MLHHVKPQKVISAVFAPPLPIEFDEGIGETRKSPDGRAVWWTTSRLTIPPGRTSSRTRPTSRFPAGETLREVQARVVETVDTLRRRYER